jgi:DNA helicase HerA-like ATPase
MLLGSLIVMQEKLAALSRSDIPEADLVLHLLVAEEAQNFIGDLESILAETRKYKLVLALATQSIEQLSREAAAVFTNCATLISFRVSSTDAVRLNEEFAMRFPGVVIPDLADLKRTCVRSLLMTGRACASPPFCRLW